MSEHEFFDSAIEMCTYNLNECEDGGCDPSVDLIVKIMHAEISIAPALVEFNKADVIYMAKLHGITAEDLT